MKTSKEHFEIFKKECQKWIEIFGLKNWGVCFYHKKDSNKGLLSWTQYEYAGRSVDIYLNTEWQDKHKNSDLDYEMKRSAFHEIAEILLYPIRYIGECRYVQGSFEIDTVVHDVIRTLETVLWEKNA